jgi:hypothetical protein
MDKFICFVQRRLALQLTVQTYLVDLCVDGKKSKCYLVDALYYELYLLLVR